MKSSEIEYWTLQVIDLVASGHAVEDSRVELKREWIDPDKAARQIAAHANAARSEPILWLIGIDEKQGVIGVKHDEFSNWLNAVASHFEGLPPSCVDLNVPSDGRVVTALLFDTVRAPFVVKNSRHGNVQGDVIAFEVPWREGRQTRSARREELLRLLVPATRAPAIEWLEAHLTIRETTSANGIGPSVRGKDRRFTWDLEARLYAEPASNLRLVIPFHRCEVEIQLPGQDERRNVNELRLNPPHKINVTNQNIGSEPDSHTIASTGSEIILEGPGMLSLEAAVHTGLPGDYDVNGSVRIWINLQASGLERPIESRLDLEPDPLAWERSGKRQVEWKWRLREGRI